MHSICVYVAGKTIWCADTVDDAEALAWNTYDAICTYGGQINAYPDVRVRIKQTISHPERTMYSAERDGKPSYE